MIIPSNIYEDPKILEYLQSRNLVKQYQKSKKFLLEGRMGGIDRKERQPTGSNI